MYASVAGYAAAGKLSPMLLTKPTTQLTPRRPRTNSSAASVRRRDASRANLGRPCLSAPYRGRRLPRCVNLSDALQDVGLRLELPVGQSLDGRDLLRTGALAPDVAHHLLLARWQGEVLKVPGDVDRGNAACLAH